MPKEVKLDWVLLEDFQKFISRLKRYNYVVGILRGGGIPAILASNTLEKDVLFVQAKSYKHKKKDTFHFTNLSVIPWVVRHKKVLLVDDVYDSGETITKVRKWLERVVERKVDVVVLVSKNPAKCHDEGIRSIRHVDKNVWVRFPWE